MSQKFLDLAVQMESLTDQVNVLREALNEEMKVMGIGKMVQDSSSGLVYKIVEPNGQFTYFKKIDYVRTAKESERAGSLSKKEAESSGFRLSK